jgi:hypothetical protein
MASVDRFIAHLHERAPRFECSAAGEDRKRRISIEIAHRLSAPAAPQHIKLLTRTLGLHAPDLIALYARHDGLELYVQGLGSGALEFFPANQWERATRTFREELGAWGRDEEDMFDFEREGVIFGEPSASGNSLFLYDGGVYYSDHDGGDGAPLAPTFAAFLDRIVEDPAKLMLDLGCYARYSDGVTDTQWIPERYVSLERPV